MTAFSIIIPTYNRPHYLKRLLDYYNKCEGGGNDFEIIVADSSSDENKTRNKGIIAAFPNLKVLYLSGYSENINPWYKFADTINHIQSKYCAFCADDDFVTPSGIRKSVDFLEDNPDFAVAHGQYIAFHLEEDERGKQQFWWAPCYTHESIAFSEPETRLNYHLSNYTQTTFFSVHRTEYLKMIYGELSKSKVDAIFCELLLSMLTIIYGKLKCLDVLYAARDNSSIDCGYWVGDSARLGYYPSLIDAVKWGVYDEEYAKFKDCLSTHLSQQSQLDIKESAKVIDNAMSAYRKKYHIPNHIPKSGTEFRSRMRYVLDSLNLPDWADEGIRRLYAELIRWKYAWKRREKRTKKHFLETPLSSKYRDDFDRIRLHVLSCAPTKLE